MFLMKALAIALSLLALTMGCHSEKDPHVLVFITETGKKYHLRDCPSARKTGTPIERNQAIDRGYEPCKNCNPDS